MLGGMVLAMFENMKSKSYKGTQRAEEAENETPCLGDPFSFAKRYIAIDAYGLLALSNFLAVI